MKISAAWNLRDGVFQVATTQTAANNGVNQRVNGLSPITIMSPQGTQKAMRTASHTAARLEVMAGGLVARNAAAWMGTVV
ncbi:MAG: hypothetical protein IT165_01250 [Bryobacterales bacterium]|nr:hypothetical protein [Bryobacterales bacterium]